MKWNLKLSDKVISLTIVEGAVAVRPSARLREQSNRSAMVKRFGATAKDDSQNGAFGLDLPSKNRRIFERAGWLFVKPNAAVASAAKTGLAVTGAEAVRQVVINSAGELMILTDIVAVQLPSDWSEEKALSQLTKDGLKLVRRLGFAPNLFETHLPPGRPVPDLSRP